MLAELSFDREQVYIGSRPGCGVHLPNIRVGLQQAVIRPDKDDGWSVEPLDEEHVTRINGSPLSGRRKVHNGDVIAIDDYLLKVYLELESQISDISRATRHMSVKAIRKHKLPAGALVKKHTDSLTLSIPYLHRASRFSRELMKCGTIRDLMELCLPGLLGTFGARCAWIGLRRQAIGDLEFVEGRHASGEPCEPTTLCLQLMYRCMERAQQVCLPRTYDDEIGSAMAVPIIGPDGHLGMFYLDRAKRADAYETIHLDLMSSFAALAGIQLEVILHQLVQRREQLEVTEVSIAHQVQTWLEPKSVPDWENLQVAVYTRPGDVHCADIYDLVKLPDGRGAILVASCTAPGAVAASVAGQLRAAFRLAALRGNTPQSLMRQINWLMSSGAEPTSVRAWTMTFDPRTGALIYCHAGELGALVVSSQGNARFLAPEPAPALGNKREIAYEPSTATLGPGETLILYTPGVTQVVSAYGESFGAERLVESLCDSFGQPAGAALAQLQSELDVFGGGGTREHDISIIVLHRSH